MIRRRPPTGLGRYQPADVFARLNAWNGQTANVPVPEGTPPPIETQVVDLERETREGEAFFKSFGGRTLANPEQPAYEVRPPWLDMPAGGQSIFFNQWIDTPATNDTDTTILQFTVPIGWDGVIQAIANFYTGPGFIPGSGFLAWRLLRNGQAIKNYDSILFALGSYGNGGIQPMDIHTRPIRIFSGELISMVVNHSSTSTLPVAGTKIGGVIAGYEYSKP